jgi:hypothetical protein
MYQQVENLRFDMHCRTAFPQFPPVDINLAVAEAVNHCRSPIRGFSGKNPDSLQDFNPPSHHSSSHGDANVEPER